MDREVEMMEADRAVTIPEELRNTSQALDNLLQSVLRQGLPDSEVPSLRLTGWTIAAGWPTAGQR
jgi:hypothetical protein